MNIIVEFEDPIWCQKHSCWKQFFWGLGDDGSLYWKAISSAGDYFAWRLLSDNSLHISFEDMLRVVKAFENAWNMKAFW